MKKAFILSALLSYALAVNAAGKEKNFSLTVDPPDAAIRVVSGNDLAVQQYRSPAKIKALVPGDRALARKAVITITRDRFKPAIVPLASILDGEVVKIKLEKDGRGKLKFQMIGPSESNEIQIRNAHASVRLDIDEQQMRMILTNHSGSPINIIWQRAQYTDINGRLHRVMHPGISYEDRNRSYSFQTVLPYQTLEQPLFPSEDASFDDRKQAFAGRPLFALETAAGLKGKVFEVLIPISVGETIVPYAFKVKILGTTKT